MAKSDDIADDNLTGAGPAEPISWELAQRVATRIAARQDYLPLGRLTVLEEDFAELTAQAEVLVEEATGLRSLSGPARARVTDRPGWVSANVASFQRLLRPLAQKLEAALAKPAPMLGPVAMKIPAQVSRNISGMQLGLLLGWMSTRVLGQYDQLLIEDDRPEDQDIVYYVGHNIIELEDRHGFQPRQFRLWIALHEVTHRAQFTGVPWLRPHFLSLVNTLVEGVDPDPKRFLEALKRAALQAREGHNPLDEGGLVALLASPEQRQALDQIGGLMSLLEGPRGHRHEPCRGGPRRSGASFRQRPATAPAAQRRGQGSEFPGRPGCQAQAVRTGGAVHRGGGTGRRPGALPAGMGWPRVVADPGRDPPPGELDIESRGLGRTA